MSLEPSFYTPGIRLGGKYRIVRLLGHGGMGAVYLAENTDIGRKVAIKVLLPQFALDAELLARFRNEARAATAVHHPGIVEMLDLGTGPSGEPFLVMEVLEGESLGGRLRRTGRLDAETAVWIGLQLLDAIVAAHAAGIVHRDLKPDNVFLVVSPRAGVKVLDFGISKFHQDQEPSLTRTQTVLGTPAYMAPEQARSARAAGPASDLYAIGAILYESLTGSPPFEGQSYNEIVARVLTEPHRPLRQIRPDLPAPLSELVDALLAKTPQERPADASEAALRLRAVMSAAVPTPDLRGALGPATLGEDLVGDTMRSPAPAGLRRHRWLLGAAGGFVAVAATIGAVAALWHSAPNALAPDAGLDASVIDLDAARAPTDASMPPDAHGNEPDAGAPADASSARRPVERPAPRPQLVPPPPPPAHPAAPSPPDAGRARGRSLDIDESNVYLPRK